MIDINNHIKDLLFLHDCVIIPNFGGIIANYKSAIIEENKFEKPSKDLTFNKNLCQNDGLLISHISKKENISYDQAFRLVSLYVEDAKVKIYRGDTFVVEGIGEFYNDKHYNLQFEPNKKGSFLVDSWGFENFELEPVYFKDIEITNEVKPIKSFKIIGRKIMYGSIAATLIIALSIIPYNADDSVSDKSKMNIIELPLGSSSKYETLDETEAEAFSVSKSKDIKVVKKIVKKPISKKVKETANSKFYVIAGSFKNMRNAMIQKRIYEQRNFMDIKIIENKKYFCVAIASYNSKEQSLKSRLVFKNKFGIDSWILRK